MAIDKIIENVQREVGAKVKQIAPQIFHDLLFQKALTYQKDESFETAKELYEKVVEINPQNSSAYNNLGNVVKALEKEEVEGINKALPYYEKAIACQSENEIAHRNLGDAYYRLGIPEKAIESYNRAFGIAIQKEKAAQQRSFNPAIPGWSLEFAEIYVASGKKEEAQVVIDNLIKSRPGVVNDAHFKEFVGTHGLKMDQKVYLVTEVVK